MTFFSVIIPTYNRADSLKKSIQSVLNQSFSDFELLVMDDGSHDHTNDVVESFGDLRIIYDWEKNSGGPANPRNRGIKRAIGVWLCFLDSGDIWYKDKLKISYEHINNNVDIIYHDFKTDIKTFIFFQKILKGRKLVKPTLIDLLVNNNPIINSSVVVRKDIIERVNYIDESDDMVAAEDYNTWLKVAEITDNFLHIPRVLGVYSILSNN